MAVQTWVPQNFGYRAWAFDPFFAGTGAIPAVDPHTGLSRITYSEVKVDTERSFTQVTAGLESPGSGLIAGRIGIFSETNELLAVTGDQSSTWNTASEILVSTVVTSLAGGTGFIAPSRKLKVAILAFWSAGGGPPSFFASPASVLFAGIPLASRSGVANVESASMPTLLAELEPTRQAIWCALS